MTEQAPQPDPTQHPHLEQYRDAVPDPVVAEVMAHASKAEEEALVNVANNVSEMTAQEGDSIEIGQLVLQAAKHRDQADREAYVAGREHRARQYHLANIESLRAGRLPKEFEHLRKDD